MNNFRCDECRFWEPMHDDENGSCRINPPVIFLVSGSPMPDEEWELSRWPVTYCEWWCGKFEPRQEPVQ